ncbi:energy transducer TonB [Lysobacter panacisoli]|uniref:Protein TonB n=1 Tax=Lysobacter panacisoli TaxID=1255263 RepID=A0ABP9L4Z8_9GAMM
MALVACVLALAACGSGSREAEPAVDVAQALPEPVLDALDGNDLRARAEDALRRQRIHSPAGDCAVDYYLALREREPAAEGVATALGELQPYVLIAAEQALAREDLDESQRLLALLARMDANAPALPRLRDTLRIAQAAADRAEGARVVETKPAVAPSILPPPAPRVAERAPEKPAIAVQANIAPPPAPPTQANEAAPTPVVAQIAPPIAPAPEVANAMPRLLVDAQPRYPAKAQNRRIEGSVQLAFTIQPDGSVSDARLLLAQPSGVFEEAALAAAARWRFEATGRRVATTRTLTFRLPPESRG